MKLTIEMAKKHIGQYIDCEKRRFHYYPMQIVSTNGWIHLKDSVGVCMKIEDGFNAVDFDFFVQK